jgi:hypothetical protein
LKKSLWYLFLVVLHLSTFGHAVSQQVGLVYRERSMDQSQSPKLFMHTKSNLLYLAISRVGAYTLSDSTLLLSEVANTQNADGYEYQYLCDCNDGDVLMHQRGFLGDRLLRFDGKGVATHVAMPNGVVSFVSLQGNGTAFCEILDAGDSSRTKFTTVDCGRTWFEHDGLPVLIMRGAALHMTQNPVRFSMARQGLGNQSYPSAVTADAGLRSIATLGSDSVVWLSRRDRPALPDTVWYADIRDSSKKRFDTVITVRGIQDSIFLRDLKLVATQNGLTFLFHRAGWYANYSGGAWTAVDTLPRPDGGPWDFISTSTISIADNILGYRSFDQDGSKLVTVILDSIAHPYNAIVLNPSISDVNGLVTISIDQKALLWLKPTAPFCLYSESEGMQLINSIVRDIDVLPHTPLLYGFTSELGEPIVVPYSDCAALVAGTGVGVLKSTTFRGEQWRSRVLGPRIQSSRGLRTPFIGSGEVISPGDKVRQFSRDGSFIKILHNRRATAVCRLDDSTLLMADRAVVTSVRPDSSADTVDITPVICTTADSAGYINSFSTLSDGTILAYVNGLRLLDLETFESKPWHCGGVIRSQDAGRTWTRSLVPVESPYFLGSVRTPSGILAASVTSVIRDTTRQTTVDQEPPLESQNHTFSDRVVIRSTDNGATWTQVYHSPRNSSFRLVGGDGVITKDGTLLLMTTDGVLKSTNDGLDWDFHDPVGMDLGAEIISMFQDTVGSPVYYCTTVGLYKEQSVTGVHDDRQRSGPQLHAARTWNDHITFWKRSGVEVKRLFSVLGVEMPLTGPPPGLYMAECATDSSIRVEPILVVSE